MDGVGSLNEAISWLVWIGGGSRGGLVSDCDFAADDARLVVSHALDLLEYGTCFLVGSEVSEAANPSWRVEMHVHWLLREHCLYFVSSLLSLQFVIA